MAILLLLTYIKLSYTKIYIEIQKKRQIGVSKTKIIIYSFLNFYDLVLRLLKVLAIVVLLSYRPLTYKMMRGISMTITRHVPVAHRKYLYYR